LAVVCHEPKSIDQVDIAYGGFSAAIDCLAEKKDVEQLSDMLLSLRTHHQPRILTVDDDPVLTQFIETILSDENMSVSQLNNPIDVMASLDVIKPDLMLLDVMMPDKDGPTTFKELQADPETSSIPVLLLTAKVHAADQTRFSSLGVIAVLAKPFDPMTLGRQIAQQAVL